MSISFYRKYRPQRFEDLDITKVREFFLRVIKSGKFSQAYLFSGPKGTGKTSAARILAMALNCEINIKHTGITGNKQEITGEMQEPCGECENCQAIRNGRSTAVVEIDAASNRGIDDIRLLQSRVGLMPTQGKYSVYIIDEVHMLTTEAFNALLKTLEEPPSHVVFCLCTTEEHKVPETIISRCVKVEYSKATADELVRSLSRVVKGENLDITDDALLVVATKAEGSFRDAAKILEQLSTSGETITKEMVISEIGEGSETIILKLLDLILSCQTKEALDVVGELEANNRDMKKVAKAILEKLRELLKFQITNNQAPNNNRKITNESQNTKQKQKASINELVKLVEVLSKAFGRFSEVPIEALPLEMAIVEYCLGNGGGSQNQTPNTKNQITNNSHKNLNESQNTKQNSEFRIQKSVEPGNQRNGEPGNLGTSEPVHNPGINGVVDNQIPGLSDNNGPNLGEDISEVVENDDIGLIMTDVQSKWSQILMKVSSKNHGLVTVLKAVKIKDCEGNRIVLGVGYKFHKQMLEQDRYLTMIEESIKEVLGVKVRLSFVLEEVVKVEKEDRILENVTPVVNPGDETFVQAVEEIFG